MGNLNLKFSNTNEYLIISDSNISLLNGIYKKSDFIGGKISYVKVPAIDYSGSGNFRIYWNIGFPSSWIIATESFNGNFYYSTLDVASPDLVPTWSIGQNGSGNISMKVTAIGKNSTKKQNLSTLKSFNFYSPKESTYIFKSALNNTLASIFNYAQFTPYDDSISIYIGGNFNSSISFYTDGSTFVYDDLITNANDYVIPANSFLIFSISNNINITVSGGAIIQKYYGGRLIAKVSDIPLTELQLWLKGDIGVVYDVDNLVSAWNDQSGNNRNFTKSIANTGYPVYAGDSVLFTAIDTYEDFDASILALPSSSLNFTTPYTLIAVIRSGGLNACVFSKSTNGPKRRKYQISVNNGIIYSLESTGAGIDTNISYDTDTGNDVDVKRLIVSQYSSNTSGLIRYNGNQVATGSVNVGIDQTNNASIFIGASPFQEGIGYNAEASAEMYVYEIIFYNRALSTIEIQKIETYLNKKYLIY